MRPVPLQKLVDLILDELWRRIFVDEARRLRRVIWEPFPIPLQEPNTLPLPELVDRVRVVLVSREEVVKLFDVRVGEIPSLAYEVENELQSRFLVIDQKHSLSAETSLLVKSLQRPKARLDQRFSDSAINRVKALDDAGFNRPESCEPLLELGQALGIAEDRLLSHPLLVDEVKLRTVEIRPVVREVGDAAPAKAKLRH
jgi:hypothetical protein